MVQCNLTSTILIWQELTSLHQNDEIFTPKREGRVTIQSCDHLVTVFYRDHIFLTIPFCDSSTKSHCSMLIQCLLYQNMMLKLIWQELTYTSTLLSPPAKWDISYWYITSVWRPFILAYHAHIYSIKVQHSMTLLSHKGI